MKWVLWTLLLASVGLNSYQYWQTGAQKQAMISAIAYLKTAPIYVHKDRATGDIYVQVPYTEKMYHFRGVCGREAAL